MEDDDFALRSTTIDNIGDVMSIELSFPDSLFVPVKAGEIREVGFLDKLIDFLNIKSNKYIMHCKAYYKFMDKVSTLIFK